MWSAFDHRRNDPHRNVAARTAKPLNQSRFSRTNNVVVQQSPAKLFSGVTATCASATLASPPSIRIRRSRSAPSTRPAANVSSPSTPPARVDPGPSSSVSSIPFAPADTLVVWRFDRLGRSVSHLVEIIEQLRAREVSLESLTEGIDTNSPAGEAVFTVIAAFAQMERRLISERTRAGIAAARKNNRPWGKKSKFHNPETVKLVKALLREGSLSKADIARKIGRPSRNLLPLVPRRRGQLLQTQSLEETQRTDGDHMKLSDACDAYLRDMKARNLRTSTQRSYITLFHAFQSYARVRGLTDLTSFDQDTILAWRESWVCEPGTHLKRFQQLKAFFSHAMQVGWIEDSPISAIKPPRTRAKPPMPLSRDEFRTLVAAAATKPKEQALLFLMRFSGLSIGDAVTLRHDAINRNNLTLRRAKSGELVMVYIPDLVIAALDRIKRPHLSHFFWSGSSMPETTAKYWRSRLNIIARKAGVKDFRPHRLRHTFSVEFLLASKSMEDLSTLLGHSSVNTTERHYAQWNLARRNRLVRITREIYECNPSLLVFDGCIPRKNNTGAVAAAPVNSSAQSSAKLNKV